jgi:hypothetical protein
MQILPLTMRAKDNYSINILTYINDTACHIVVNIEEVINGYIPKAKWQNPVKYCKVTHPDLICRQINNSIYIDNLLKYGWLFAKYGKVYLVTQDIERFSMELEIINI